MDDFFYFFVIVISIPSTLRVEGSRAKSQILLCDQGYFVTQASQIARAKNTALAVFFALPLHPILRPLHFYTLATLHKALHEILSYAVHRPAHLLTFSLKLCIVYMLCHRAHVTFYDCEASAFDIRPVSLEQGGWSLVFCSKANIGGYL